MQTKGPLERIFSLTPYDNWTLELSLANREPESQRSSRSRRAMLRWHSLHTLSTYAPRRCLNSYTIWISVVQLMRTMRVSI